MSDQSYDVVIIGGSVAGITAGVTCRRHYREKSILMIREEENVLIPCGIPYIFGTVGNVEKNLISDTVLEKHDIDLLVDSVGGIDTERRTVSTSDGKSIGYERLVLATGSVPVVLPLPGFDKKNIFTIKKSVSHLENMLKVMKDVEKLVIVGGGFIGVEFADECHRSPGVDVTIVEILPHCLDAALDDEFCDAAENLLRDRGINLITGSRVEGFVGDEKVAGVRLADGTELEAEAVIQSVGVRPNAELAKKSGIEIGPSGGIKVDRALRTSDPSVFACGDCAEKVSFFTGEACGLRLASIATTESRVVGANLFGVTRSYPGAVGVYSTVVGDTAFGTAGLTESLARDAGYCIATGQASSRNRHPGMMPGAADLTLELTFERQTRTIIGGQMMGAKSGGELINAVSACIQQKMTADEIATFQTGTHPALTASPVAYQLVNAAEEAIGAMRQF